MVDPAPETNLETQHADTVRAPKPYYDENGVTIYHGDCREILPFLTADVVITDPPYGVGYKYGEGYGDTAEEWEQLVPPAFERPASRQTPTTVEICRP